MTLNKLGCTLDTASTYNVYDLNTGDRVTFEAYHYDEMLEQYGTYRVSHVIANTFYEFDIIVVKDEEDIK